jgi:ubiquinone/menaquinone biosynthesis C-methylase UbiE
MTDSDAEMAYLAEIFEGLPRGGPGDDGSTRKAFEAMSGLPPHPRILDIGCGPGMPTRALARVSGGTVVALDIFRSFLDSLRAAAEAEGLAGRIQPVQGDMNAMSFLDASFDVVWSEGALFVMGFENGLREIRRLLRPGGSAAVSEAVYLTEQVPAEARAMWDEEYPAIGPVEANLPIIEKAGLTPVTHFILPREAWVEFYGNLERKLDRVETRYQGNDAAMRVIESCRTEIRINRKYGETYGYAFYVMRRD